MENKINYYQNLVKFVYFKLDNFYIEVENKWNEFGRDFILFFGRIKMANITWIFFLLSFILFYFLYLYIFYLFYFPCIFSQIC